MATRYPTKGIRSLSVFLLVLLAIGISIDTLAASDIEQCLIDRMRELPDSTSLGELKNLCEPALLSSEPLEAVPLPDVSRPSWKERGTDFEYGASQRQCERATGLEVWECRLTPHFPNYFSFSWMDEPNQEPFSNVIDAQEPVEDTEAVFQVSFKAPVAIDLFGTDLDAYFAYTSKSWWQITNGEFSSPFRETNYQPELFLRSDKSRFFPGVALREWSLGLVHESNGREQTFSRSWNRVEARAGLQLSDELSLFARAWYRFPEEETTDDNPDLYKYRGYGSVRAIWTPNRNTFTAMLRPATEGSSVELTWSYPINRVFRLYGSYFEGYGESLLDYDYSMRRVSFGIALNDFLARYALPP
ncbi:MAG: phospholipase A [Pseudomonadota bacterium]